MKTINNVSFPTSYEGDDKSLLMGLKMIQAMATQGYLEKNLMKIRDAESGDAFKAFVHYFLQHTISKSNWLSGRSVMKVSDLFTPVDEAFAILLMINHWKEWEHLAEGHTVDRQNKLTMYTHCYKEKDEGEVILGKTSPSCTVTVDSSQGSSASSSISIGSGCSTSKKSTTRKPPKVKGWSREGLKKFTEICKHVHGIRNKPSQVSLENVVMQHYAALDANNATGNTRKRGREEVSETLDEAPFSMYQVAV